MRGSLTSTLINLYNRRVNDWEKLEGLIEKIEKEGRHAFTSEDVLELSYLYRRGLSDLSLMSNLNYDSSEKRLLNNLLGKAHTYLHPKRGKIHLLKFFWNQPPLCFQNHQDSFALVFAIFIFSFIFAIFCTSISDNLAYTFVGPHWIEEIRSGRTWLDSIWGVVPSSLLSITIFQNNLSVALLCFALGSLAGLGTTYLLVTNGMMLGSILFICLKYGAEKSLLTFIISHGFLEILCILVSSQAGFVMASGLLKKSEIKRSEAFRISSRDGMIILLGSLPFLFLAAIVEGFISPNPDIPFGVKAVIGPSIALIFLFYLYRPIEKGGSHVKLSSPIKP